MEYNNGVIKDTEFFTTAELAQKLKMNVQVITRKVQAGVAVVNAGTFGSEPHMPFGGLKQSGNGTREPGTEALDVYSDLKNIIINIDPKQI